MRALFHKIMKRKRCSAAGGRRLAAPGSGSGFGVKGFAGRHERAGRSSEKERPAAVGRGGGAYMPEAIR